MLDIEEIIPANEPELLDAEAAPSSLPALIDDGTALQDQDRAELAMTTLEAKYKGKVFDVTTKDGEATAREARRNLVKMRTGVDKLIKSEYDEYKKTKTFADSLKERIVALEEPIDAAIKAEEDRKAAEKAERERIERERILVITGKVEVFRNIPVGCVSLTADQIEVELDGLAEREITIEEFGDFAGEAMQAISKSIATLNDMIAAKRAAEAETQRLKDEAAKAEAERQEREAKERAEREAAEAKAKQEQAEADAKAKAERDAAELIAKSEREELARKNAEATEALRIANEKLETFMAAEKKRNDEAAQKQADENERAFSAAQKLADQTGGRVIGLEPAPEVPTLQQQLHAVLPDVTLGDAEPACPRHDFNGDKERPSDDSIIQAVANAFEVDDAVALRWIIEVGKDAEAAELMRKAA